MITFPVKTNKENSAVSPLFGKAKYFAFYDGKNLSIEENPFSNGSALIDWFKEKGVKDIIIKEMGINPYNKLKQSDINIYYSGDERIVIDEVIEKYKNKSLEKLSEDRMLKIIKQHENSHTHDHNHSHQHSHLHSH